MSLSFEFFPPKTAEGSATLIDTAKRLAVIKPDFMTMTYGAGGSTKTATKENALAIAAATNIPMAAHLTCVGADQASINAIAMEYFNAGIKRIIALRGDMPGDAEYAPYPDGYGYAVDLTKGLINLADFDISVAAYPEAHPQAISLDNDIKHLKAKQDAGAKRAITQFFFDETVYIDFVKKCRDAGITMPIIPGLLTIQNLTQLKRFAGMCGATIPQWLETMFAGADDDVTPLLSAHILCSQVKRLQDYGVSDYHFYTMNKAPAVLAACQLLKG